MKLEELIAKMEQIEEQAAVTLHEYPGGHAKERLRLLLAIAKQVRAHLTDQLESGSREALLEDSDLKVHVIQGRTSSANS